MGDPGWGDEGHRGVLVEMRPGSGWLLGLGTRGPGTWTAREKKTLHRGWRGS